MRAPGEAAGWEVVPLRRLCDFRRGRSYSSSDYGADGEGVPFITLKCVDKGGGFSARGLKWFTGPLEPTYFVASGDLLLANTDLTPGGEVVGSPVVVPDLPEGTSISLDLTRLDVHDQMVDRRYLFFALSDGRTRIFMKAAARGTTVLHLELDRAKDCPIRLPPRNLQWAIADYLDAEKARIDALIAKKQQLIHLLQERIDAAVMEVVGRSEISATGREPSVEIRRVLQKLDRMPTADEMITAFRDGQVTSRTARGKEGFTNSWTDNARVQGVQVGDVVVHGLDGFSGAVGDSEEDGVCSPVYHVCQPKDGGDPAFYGRLLRRLALTGYLGNFAVSTRERAVDFRNWDLFGRIPIPLVSIEQQREIGSRIRVLRPLVDLVEKSEVLAAERKSALITRVVTGEFVVPGVA